MKFALALFALGALHAETGRDAWLRYAPVPAPVPLPAAIASFGDAPVIGTARAEVIRGVRGISNRILRDESGKLPSEPAILLGPAPTLTALAPEFRFSGSANTEGFWLRTATHNGLSYTLVAGSDDREVLYAAFALLRRIALGQSIQNLDIHESPAVAVRWINQWDNLDGSIERGYGGRSLFWDNGHAREDLSRVSEYGRLLASVGINACAINNVNANPKVLSPELIPQIARIAAAFRPWGVRVALSVDFGSPKTIGGLDTFDPVDPKVGQWWAQAGDAIYKQIPDFAGFVLKADSEGRVGPSTYNRTHADAANVVARALKPHDGILLYRGFVYDHHMDWNNPKNDRARAAFDNFKPLDGKFDSNVIIQVKNGPIDFQVREPASPLFGALEHTNEAMELQITQEYLGQGRHVVFLGQQWKEVLDFGPPVKKIIKGMIGVSNAGLDDNWYGSDMSQANLYAFGRLAWNPNLAPATLIDEWTRQTFNSNPRVVQTVSGIQMRSWRAYENYTGPLGLQTLTDIVGNHYGVAVEASERNGWGQWHNADENGVGLDRTVATGTGYIGQYPKAIADQFESLKTCPDDLVLFMHHVPYTHVLHNNKTVIQTLYDDHYEGAAIAAQFVREWETIKGQIDDQRYNAILTQLKYQAMRAEVWRDAVNDWFFKTSKIADTKARVGSHPGRVEAEAMTLENYQPVDVTPWEAASGGKAISCPAQRCTAGTSFSGKPGSYTLRVQYFDLNNGASTFRLKVNNQLIDEWQASDRVPSRKIDGSTSNRRTVESVALRAGDRIVIEGIPDAAEPAPLDYLEIFSADSGPRPPQSAAP